MALLRVKKGGAAGALYMVPSTRKPSVIGRDDSVEISLSDDRASRRHAAICLDRGRWIIQDLRSSNGTIVQGKKVTKALLGDGAGIQVGTTLLSFHSEEFAPPPPVELSGLGSLVDSVRPLETYLEEAGVSVCHAVLAGASRDVRMDTLSEHRMLAADAARLLEQALREASNLSQPEFLKVLGAEVAQGTASIVLDSSATPPFGCAGGKGDLDRFISQPLSVRIDAFRTLVAAVLERSTWEGQRYPIGLPHIVVRFDDRGDGNAVNLCIPALDLGAFVAWQTRDFIHIPHYAAYLPPEMQAGGEESESRPLAGAMYNLGAIGYHFLTGQPPMGKGDVKTTLERHRRLQPAPADLVEPELPKKLAELLERMLAKEPAARPSGRSGVLQSIPRAPVGPPARVSARTTSRDSPGASIPRPPSGPLPAHASQSAEPSRPSPPEAVAQRESHESMESAQAVIPWYYRTLPLWIVLWVGLFFVVRFLAREFFFSIGL